MVSIAGFDRYLIEKVSEIIVFSWIWHQLLSDQKKRKLRRPKYRCIADFDGKNGILLIFSPEMDVLAYFD